jgi:hypothetical protein
MRVSEVLLVYMKPYSYLYSDQCLFLYGAQMHQQGSHQVQAKKMQKD